MLSNFRWYRRWRGGKWAKVTGYLSGQRWVHCPASVEQVDENYTQTTFCYCPQCRHELCSDPRAFISDKEFVVYRCPNCGFWSKWNFDAPVPLYIKGDSTLYSRELPPPP